MSEGKGKPRTSAITCAVIAGSFLAFFIITSVIARGDGANIGGGIALILGIPFAAMAAYLWIKAPPGSSR